MSIKNQVKNLTLISGLAVVIASGLTPRDAAASVEDYLLEWWWSTDQIANNTPPVAGSNPYAFGVGIWFTPGDGVTAVTLNHDDFTSPIVLDDELGDGTQWGINDPRYATKEALLAAFPASSTYTIAITGGSKDGTTTAVVVGDEDFPSSFPYLTGDTFNNLHGMDARDDFTFTWNDPITAGAYRVKVDIDELSDSGEDLWVYRGSTETLATMPASTLEPNTAYGFALGFDNRVVVDTALGIGKVGFESETHVREFQTAPVPVPAALPLFLSALIGLGVIGNRRRQIPLA